MTDPLDEDIALWTFRALDALHMQRAIVIAYNKTARYFEEEMGRPLCAEIGSIYAAAAEAVNKTEQDFAAIRDELSDEGRSQRSDRGAFYCNYEVFKRMYAIGPYSAARAAGGGADAHHRSGAGRRPCTRGGSAGRGDGRFETGDRRHAAQKRHLYKKYSRSQYMRCCCPMLSADDMAVEERRLSAAYESARTQAAAFLEFRGTVLAELYGFIERRFKNRSRVTRPPVA